MAIRVLNRPLLHRLITLNPKLMPPFPSPNTHSLSTNSSYPSPPQFQHRNLIPLSNLFRRYGFPPSELHNFITKNRYLLNTSPSELDKSLRILQSLNLSQGCLVSMVHDCPQVLELEFLEKWEVGISEMGVSGTTSLLIQNVLEISRKFDLDPDDLSKCVQRLKGFGFSDVTVTRILEVFPTVIMMREVRIYRIVKFLQGTGIHKSEIDRVFNKFPGVLAFGVENKLKPLLDEFEDTVHSLDVVRKEILRDPRILGLEVGELTQILKMLRCLKCRVSIKEQIFLEGPFRAGYEVKLRIDCLRKYGLIYTEAFTVLWKEPRAILYDIKDIENKIEFLVNAMNFDVQRLIEVPEYLGMNFEKQIVPRHNVIEYLRSKGGLGDEVGLRSLIKPSRHRFYNLYVKPYPECEKIYGKFAANVEGRRKHPVGMWKLFKPQKYSDSKEDVKNIKSFVECLV